MVRRKKGILFVVSAPSGAGKTTLCRMLLERVEGISFSVSYTTRPPRKGEVHGVDYFFVDRRTFEGMIEKGEFLEYAQVHGNLYGTSRSYVEERLSKGEDLILDIDVQGARQVFDKVREDAVGIFIFPPSFEELKKRLLSRGTDPLDVIEKRLKVAQWEMAQAGMYHYWLVNDRLEEAYRRFEAIVLAERSRSFRMERI